MRLFALAGLSLALPALADEGASEGRKHSTSIGLTLRLTTGPYQLRTEGDRLEWLTMDMTAGYFVTDATFVQAHVLTAMVRENEPPIGCGEHASCEPESLGGYFLGGGVYLLESAGLRLEVGQMRQRALLLSPYDPPNYLSDLKFAVTGGPFYDRRFQRVRVAAAAELLVEEESVNLGGNGDDTLVALAVPVLVLLALGEHVELGVKGGFRSGVSLRLEGARTPAALVARLTLPPFELTAACGYASLISTPMYGSTEDSLFFELGLALVQGKGPRPSAPPLQ